jgi:hypothetical protein
MPREAPDPLRTPSDFGGSSIGSSFFGWLVATALSVLLAALAVALSSLAGVHLVRSDLAATSDINGLPAAIGLLVVLALSYFGGGYVAGRLARFRGVRAGFGVWAIAGLATILLAALGALIGSQFNLLAQIELPRLSLAGTSVALGGLVTMVVSSAITLVASLVGGRLGERYHVRIDRHLAVPDVPAPEPGLLQAQSEGSL